MARHPLNSSESAQTSGQWQEPGAGMSRVRRPGLGMRTQGWCVLRGVLVRTGDWTLRLRRGRVWVSGGHRPPHPPPVRGSPGESERLWKWINWDQSHKQQRGRCQHHVMSPSDQNIKSGDVLSKMKPDANTTLPSFKFKIEPNPCLILISD